MEEIERKFLVKSQAFKDLAKKKTYYEQAYLNTHPERTVRVRIADDKAFLTIKGKSTKNGLSRFEWEKQIPLEEAKELLKLCEPGKIQKYRYLVPQGKHTFEVDEFLGDNEGLLLAEIELENEDEEFEEPNWLDREVTGDMSYYNSKLISNPFKNRKK